MTVSRRRLFGAAASVGMGGPLLAGGGMIPVSRALADEAPETPGGAMSPFVDVRAFGARGDGVADDGPAIQRAIDSLATQPEQNQAGGGTVSFPAGEFLVTRTIVLNHGVTLAGAGRKATMVRAAPGLAGAVIAFDRTGLPPSADRVTLRDLFVKGARVPGQTGLYLSNVHSWLVSDAWIGWCDTGVRLVATWIGEFRNSRAKHNLGAGLVTAKSDDGGPHQIVFTASVFDANDVGLELTGARHCWLLGCSLEKNRLGGLRTSNVRNVTVLAHFEANGAFDIA
ncbi:MAG: glycosyl hydrolase family 28-related protein, partial [Alphaproteobacteria bacterium]